MVSAMSVQRYPASRRWVVRQALVAVTSAISGRLAQAPRGHPCAAV